MKRVITLQIEVTVPARVGESEVEQAINAALDEGTNDVEWGAWEVGPARITEVEKVG